MKLKHLVFLLLIGRIAFGQSTFIKFNEYSFSNYNTVADPLGTMGLPSYSPDWVELRNNSTQKKGNLQQLSGIFISDDRWKLHKWQFPYNNNLPIKLDSADVIIVLLCGHNTLTTTGPLGTVLHANFDGMQTKRNTAGKLITTLYLTKSVNATIPYDSVHIQITKPGHSWGQCHEIKYKDTACGNSIPVCPDVAWPAGWRLYPNPTPAAQNPKWPAYYTDYLPKPVFDNKPGYYGSYPTITMTDTSNLSLTSVLGYTNYPSVCIIATSDCTPPDTLNSISPGTALVSPTSVQGTPLSWPYTITTSTAVPPPTGYMVRAIMHDGTTNPLATPVITPTTVPSFTATPRYLDSFEAYGAYYDSAYSFPVMCTCVDTNMLFKQTYAAAAKDTSFAIIDYFKSGVEMVRNQGQAMISKLDFFNPVYPTAQKKLWQFSFRAEDEYGYTYTTRHQFFTDPILGATDRDDFRELVFRAGSEEAFLNSPILGTNYFPAAHIRDFYNHTTGFRRRLDFESQHYTPTYMLINGVNKGIYYIKEPFDSTYTDYYFQRPVAAILSNGVLGGNSPSSCAQFNVQPTAGFGTTGGNAVFRWNKFYTWAMSSSTKIHIPTTYYQLADSIDFQSLNDYTIYHMLSVNSNYLKRSAIWWKGLPTDTTDHRTAAKWRCALANTDNTWGFNENNWNGIQDNTPSSTPCDMMLGFGLDWDSQPLNVPANSQYPLMALWFKLMQNDTFQHEFLARYLDLLNGALSCDSLTDHLKYVRSLFKTGDMASHVWWNLYNPSVNPGMDSVHYWNLAMDSMNAFIMQRCSLVTKGMADCFHRNGPFNLCVDVSPAGTGYVTLNTLTLKNFVWNGKYLDSVTQIAKAYPEKNYQFDHWETSPLATYPLYPDNKSDSINFYVSTDLCIKAVFKLLPGDQTYGPNPAAPSGFSPNGDGNNDIFNLYGIAEASSYELEVYNRWGEMIFRSIDKSHGWDGVFNGAPVPSGVYAYRYNIIMNGKTYKSKGSVTLLR